MSTVEIPTNTAENKAERCVVTFFVQEEGGDSVRIKKIAELELNRGVGRRAEAT